MDIIKRQQAVKYTVWPELSFNKVIPIFVALI